MDHLRHSLVVVHSLAATSICHLFCKKKEEKRTGPERYSAQFKKIATYNCPCCRNSSSSGNGINLPPEVQYEEDDTVKIAYPM